MSWKRWLRDHVLARIPLALRQRVALKLHRQGWLPGRDRWTVLLLRDFARLQPSEYQRFVWAHGLERAARFHRARGIDRSRSGLEGGLVASRQLLLDDLRRLLLSGSCIAPGSVSSVLDAGCSSGFMLHACHQQLFPAANRLLGVDVDDAALQVGSEWLARRGSPIELRAGDLRQLDSVLAGETFDLVLCTGVLQYFPAPEVAAVIASLLRHTRGVLVLSGPACREVRNDMLARSCVRADFTFVHNFQALVELAGGSVVGSRWEGPALFDGQTVYFLFATPATVAPRVSVNSFDLTVAS